MSRRLIPATATEVAHLLARRKSPFLGYVPDPKRQVAGLRQLREHLDTESLRGPILSNEQLVARATEHAAAMEAEVVELEREIQLRTPLVERVADYPETLKLLGLCDRQASSPAEHTAGPSDRVELGEQMRRVLRGAL